MPTIGYHGFVSSDAMSRVLVAMQKEDFKEYRDICIYGTTDDRSLVLNPFCLKLNEFLKPTFKTIVLGRNLGKLQIAKAVEPENLLWGEKVSFSSLCKTWNPFGEDPKLWVERDNVFIFGNIAYSVFKYFETEDKIEIPFEETLILPDYVLKEEFIPKLTKEQHDDMMESRRAASML